jgi:pantoate--beta-alanine ligase
MTLGTRAASMVRSRDELTSTLAARRAAGATTALVPTMGALHAGHLSLFERARELADDVVVSIFVNPLQFGEGEDLRRYPRNLVDDVRVAEEHGAGVIFAPEVHEMFPGGSPVVRVVPGIMGERLCGIHRPGHFEGVLTVVARLFGLVQPDVAVFGRKDLQQAALIRRMVKDLALRVHVDVAPLVREFDGLALSSRNVYLSAEERRDATGLFSALQAADRAFIGGEVQSSRLVALVRDIIRDYQGLELQYAEVVNPDTLEQEARASRDSVLAVAGLCGDTRLIDNIRLGSGDADPRVAWTRSGSPGPLT